MGPLRHQQLIRLLAFLVALDLGAGVVALYSRAGTASAATPGGPTSQAAERSTVPGGAGGILAGAQFSRRRSGGGSGRPTAPAGGSGAATRGSPTSSTGGPTTTSTARPATSSTGGPTTTSTAGPTTSPTEGPTTSSTVPSGAAAPHPTPTTTSTAPSGPAPAGSAGPSTIEDRAGDTTVEGTGKAKAEDRADIVRAQAIYRSGAVILAAQVRQPSDPRQDPSWASESTYLNWEIDTNGDAVPDFEVQYFVDSGTPVAGVSRVNDTAGDAACGAEANYTAGDGFVVAFEPGCIGGPASFSYRVTMYYDTDPKNEGAPVVKDVTPDGGLSRPVNREATSTG